MPPIPWWAFLCFLFKAKFGLSSVISLHQNPQGLLGGWESYISSVIPGFFISGQMESIPKWNPVAALTAEGGEHLLIPCWSAQPPLKFPWKPEMLFFFFFYLNPHVLQISLLTQQEMSLWVMLMLLSLGILFPIKRLHLNNYPDLRCIWTMSPAAGQILNLLQPTEWKEEWI